MAVIFCMRRPLAVRLLSALWDSSCQVGGFLLPGGAFCLPCQGEGGGPYGMRLGVI